jgi:hypothetical protein
VGSVLGGGVDVRWAREVGDLLIVAVHWGLKLFILLVCLGLGKYIRFSLCIPVLVWSEINHRPDHQFA